MSFTLSSLSVCKHSLEESTLEAASGQVSTQEDEHTQTPPSPRCLGPSARLMGTLYVFVLAATVSVVYTVISAGWRELPHMTRSEALQNSSFSGHRMKLLGRGMLPGLLCI